MYTFVLTNFVRIFIVYFHASNVTIWDNSDEWNYENTVRSRKEFIYYYAKSNS